MNRTTITWTDLVRLKKAAKVAKAEFPNLTYMQRLDVLAARDFGVRHFHELQQRCETDVHACLEDVGGLLRCRLCGLQFDGTEQADVDIHRKQHALYLEAEGALGYLPAQYEERERTKKLGYAWMRSPNPGTQREGALAILLAQFDRSLDAAITNGRWGRHPYFDEYVQAALPGANFIPDDIKNRLIAEFGVRPGVMSAESSYWPVDARRGGQVQCGESSVQASVRRRIADS